MPTADITQSADYWNLHTEELIEEAARDIFGRGDLGSQTTRVVRTWGMDGHPGVLLEVQQSNTSPLPCPMGTTVVRTAAGWEVLTDDEAVARGLPIPTLEP